MGRRPYFNRTRDPCGPIKNKRFCLNTFFPAFYSIYVGFTIEDQHANISFSLASISPVSHHAVLHPMYSVLFFVIVGDGVEIWSRFWSSRLGKSRDLPVFFFKCSFCGATIREKTFDTSKNIFHQRGNIVKTFILRPGVCLANSSELQSQLLRPNIPTNIVCDIFLLFFVSWESWRWKREKEIFCIFCTSCIFYTFLHILHSLHILHIFAYVVCFANSSYCSYFAYSHILDILYILHFLHILHILQGHSCKIGNMRCPGTLKNQNPQFEEKK